LKVHEALEVLARANARLAQVVEMRISAATASGEIAAALGVTERTVQRDWGKARRILEAVLSRFGKAHTREPSHFSSKLCAVAPGRGSGRSKSYQARGGFAKYDDAPALQLDIAAGLRSLRMRLTISRDAPMWFANFLLGQALLDDQTSVHLGASDSSSLATRP